MAEPLGVPGEGGEENPKPFSELRSGVGRVHTTDETGAHAAFVYGNTLGLRDIQTFEVRSHTPHGLCLHFRPRVAATPARLDPGLPATALTGWDLHPQATISFA